MSYNLSKHFMLTLRRKFTAQPFLIEAVILLFLALAAIAINAKMIHDGLFLKSHDILNHITWLQHFSKELSEGIWYPRWLSGTNFGYGSPTFVFYPPLVYYIGSALKLSGLNIEQTIIALFSLAIFGGGLSFYIYGHNRWGRISSFVGALAYMTAPYITLNVAIRGALAEMWALVWIPLILWLTDQAILSSKWRVLLAIIFAVFALTHVPSLLVCTIFWFIYTLCFLFSKSWKDIITTIGSVILGLGIASPYLLPAILEQPLISTNKLRGVSGGFQANLIGTQWSNNFRFIHGYIQPIFIYELLVSLMFIVIAVYSYRQDRLKIKETFCWIFFLLTLSFLMNHYSTPIWQSSRTLQMIQFPWRLLGLFSFAGAALCGLAVRGIIKTSRGRNLNFFLSLTTIVILLLGNIGYSYKMSWFLPTLHNPGKYVSSNRYLQLQKALYEPYRDQLADIPEYRPQINNGNSVLFPIIGQPAVSLETSKGSIHINLWASYNRVFNVILEEASTIKIRTYYYPAWHLYVNKKPHPIQVSSDGTIKLQLNSGTYIVELNYLWTGSFKLGVLCSISSIIFLIFFWIKTQNKSLKL